MCVGGVFVCVLVRVFVHVCLSICVCLCVCVGVCMGCDSGGGLSICKYRELLIIHSQLGGGGQCCPQTESTPFVQAPKVGLVSIAQM